ncbi:MAG: leucine-rich repeat protein [Clostridium sp.]|nr:leucine-rich repeat protein [Clostridium sp.]
MKKKLLSMILVLALTVSVLFCFDVSMVFGATSGNCGATGSKITWSYNASTKTLTLTGTGTTKNYGDTVLAARPWDDFKDEIEKIEIGSGITTIGRLNFYNCTALTEVVLPDTLTTIGAGLVQYGPFRGCSALKSIKLPEGLTTIDAYAFQDCTALESIKFPNSLTTLGSFAFTGCTSLDTVTYGTGMTSTGVEAFRSSGVKNIVFSPTITSIDRYSFYETNIVNIEIPETVTSIGLRAFANCSFISTATVYNANCTFNGIIGEDPFNGSNQSLTMRGHKGSTTETYAAEKGYKFESIDSCDHESTHEVIAKEATCTETGTATQVCDTCGWVVSETEIPALGHDWNLADTDDESLADGHIYRYYACSICNEERRDVEHVSFLEGFYEYSTTATCTKSGLETYTCVVEDCGKVERKVALRSHQVDEYKVVTAPTCTSAGSEEGVCTLCQETVTRELSAIDHDYVEIRTEDKTQENGHTYVVYECSMCHKENNVATHVDWVEGYYASTVVIKPRCVISGQQRDDCLECTERRYVTIPANGQHEWQETTRTEPTCTSVGTIFYACANCTLTKSESIEALGHEYVAGDSVQPTCTTAGYENQKCTRCGGADNKIIPATGHTADSLNYTIISSETCTEDGEAESVCSVCGESFSIILEKLGHNMENVVVPIEEEPGHSMSTPTCTRCGQTEPGTKIHDEWLEGYYTSDVTVKGTCTIPEVTRDTCTICNTTRTQRGEANGHKYSYTKTQNNGTLVYTCSVCNNEETMLPSAIATTFQIHINQNTGDSTYGYRYDLNGDGIINAKDYYLINKAVQKAKLSV